MLALNISLCHSLYRIIKNCVSLYDIIQILLDFVDMVRRCVVMKHHPITVSQSCFYPIISVNHEPIYSVAGYYESHTSCRRNSFIWKTTDYLCSRVSCQRVHTRGSWIIGKITKYYRHVLDTQFLCGISGNDLTTWKTRLLHSQQEKWEKHHQLYKQLPVNRNISTLSNLQRSHYSEAIQKEYIHR